MSTLMVGPILKPKKFKYFPRFQLVFSVVDISKISFNCYNVINLEIQNKFKLKIQHSNPRK
jgi:hypothetical protein